VLQETTMIAMNLQDLKETKKVDPDPLFYWDLLAQPILFFHLV
jgi:hypothetical protein